MTRDEMLVLQQTLIDAAGLLDNKRAMGVVWSDWETNVRSRITKSLEIIELASAEREFPHG